MAARYGVLPENWLSLLSRASAGDADTANFAKLLADTNVLLRMPIQSLLNRG